MNVLVTYDVDTTTKAGRTRLRNVAKVCKNYGQRVQFSVFECRVDAAQYEALLSKLKKAVKVDTDSLRIYKLRGERDDFLQTFGLDKYVDFDEPLVL